MEPEDIRDLSHKFKCSRCENPSLGGTGLGSTFSKMPDPNFETINQCEGSWGDS